MLRVVSLLIALTSILHVETHPEPKNEIQTSNKSHFNTLSIDNDTKVTAVNSTDSKVLSDLKYISTEEKTQRIIDSIADSIVEYVKNSSAVQSRRSNTERVVQPEIVYLGNQKPSVMLKMNTSSFLDMLVNALQSKKLESYVQVMSRRAANAFKAIHKRIEEIDREKLDK